MKLDGVYKFKITFNYDKEKGTELKALSKTAIINKLGVTDRVGWTLDKPDVKKGVAVYTGKQEHAYNGGFHIGAFLDVFKDLGHDFVVTWEEKDSSEIIDNPVVTDYVTLNDDGTLLTVNEACCGKYTTASVDKPGVIEIYGYDALKEPWVDIAEGMTFDKFRTDFTIEGSFEADKKEAVTSFDVNDFAKAVGAKIIKQIGEIDLEKGELLFQGVTDGPIDFRAAKEYMGKYFDRVYIQWFCKDAPETEGKYQFLSYVTPLAELPVMTTPICGELKYMISACPSGESMRGGVCTFGKDQCRKGSDWDFVRGVRR